MSNPDNNKLYDAIIASSGGKIDRKTVENAKKGDISGVLSSLPEEDARKLKETLSDKEKTRQLLSSDAAKALINMFLGGSK